jgi:hypothetical protein
MIDLNALAQRRKQVAINAGCPECDHVLFENYLRPHADGYAIEALLPKGWLLSDFSPTENLIEIENINDGSRFWMTPFELFYKDFSTKQKVVIIKKGATFTSDKDFQVKATVAYFTAETRRKRCYLQAIFEPDDKEVPAGVSHLEEPKDGELKINWQAMDEAQESMVLCCHAAALKTRDFDTLRGLFNLGNPEIIFGEKLSYCRVAKESIELMIMLTKTYLK